jgi:hypothetical protein
MTHNPALQTGHPVEAAPQLNALNGMRFFAVFHIFLFHLWSVRFEMGASKPGASSRMCTRTWRTSRVG